MFKLSKSEILRIQEKKKCYPNPMAASIDSLKIVQEKRGWVCDDAIISVSKILGISESHLEGIATFYNQIFRKPVGKYVIRYCDSLVCFVNNSEKIKKSLEYNLKIKTGETTKDNKFTLLSACCLGVCDKSPGMLINKNIHVNLNYKGIPDLLEQYKL